MSVPAAAVETVLEQQRQYHEEIERTLLAAATARATELVLQRQRINAEHMVKDMAQNMTDRAQRLAALYDDPAREREAEALAENAFGAFYARLHAVREHHRHMPSEILMPSAVRLPDEFQPPKPKVAKAKAKPQVRPQKMFQLPEDMEAEPDPEELEAAKIPPNPLPDYVEFTDEERMGRYLDLHSQHELFINLKGVKPLEYIDYVVSFHELQKIGREVKRSGAYARYLRSLLDYLVDFFGRAFVLQNVEIRLSQTRSDFNIMWAQGMVPGWEKEAEDVQQQQQQGPEPLDLALYSSAKELEAAGLDRLKSALTALGLKCGGSLSQRAERLFQTKGKSLDQLDKSLFADTKKKKEAGGNHQQEAHRSVAEMEAQISTIAVLLKDVQKATKDNVERKLARAAGEIEEEDEELVKLIDFKTAVPEEPLVKRTNVVLDWEGKPIPYWLYRLHGLNQTFKCEICGDYTYRGPKSFTDHFTEWRHAQGMRQLGIPNTKHFMNITTIADAQLLWARLQETKEQERFQADQEEEYEDNLGNVFTKRTYDDLKRQGLL